MVYVCFCVFIKVGVEESRRFFMVVKRKCLADGAPEGFGVGKYLDAKSGQGDLHFFFMVI
jgi:hypothetical protein